MSNTCFLCLNNTNNKVCETCNCFSHPQCWGKYLKDQSRIITIVFDTHFTISSDSIKCPICKEKIKNVKPITRSDTKPGRKFALDLKITQIIEELLTITDRNKRKEILSSLFTIFITNRIILMENKIFLKKVQEKLKELYNDGWESANLFYLQLFEKQIL